MENTCRVNNFLVRSKMNVCKGVKSKVFLWQEKIVEAEKPESSYFHLIYDGSKNHLRPQKSLIKKAL